MIMWPARTTATWNEDKNMDEGFDSFKRENCHVCKCYTCEYNAHAKPDEHSMVDTGRILHIPIEKKCIGCSYCYVNQRQVPRVWCHDYKEDANA